MNKLWNKIITNKLWIEWIQRDLIYLTLIVVCVAGCLYTILYDGNCADKCENFIKEEIGKIDCSSYAGFTDEKISDIFVEKWESEDERN